MKRMHPFTVFKHQQKARAAAIREAKDMRKKVFNGHVPGLEKLRSEYRHHHIAYCELRGRERSQIETARTIFQKKDGTVIVRNAPDEETITQIKNYWRYEILMFGDCRKKALEAAAVAVAPLPPAC